MTTAPHDVGAVKRAEEIEFASLKEVSGIDVVTDAHRMTAFKRGARWADSNPIRKVAAGKPREIWVDDIAGRVCGPWDEIKDMKWPDCEKVLKFRQVTAADAARDAKVERLIDAVEVCIYGGFAEDLCERLESALADLASPATEGETK